MPFTTLQVFSSYSLPRAMICLNEYVETGKLLGYKQLAQRMMACHAQWSFMSAVFKWNSTDSRCKYSRLHGRVMLKKRKCHRLCSALASTNFLKLSTLYRQGITWTKEMTKWIATHSEDVKIVLPPMDSE